MVKHWTRFCPGWLPLSELYGSRSASWFCLFSVRITQQSWNAILDPEETHKLLFHSYIVIMYRLFYLGKNWCRNLPYLPGFRTEGGGPWNFLPPPPRKLETLYSVFAHVWTLNLMLTHQVSVIHVSSKNSWKFCLRLHEKQSEKI